MPIDGCANAAAEVPPRSTGGLVAWLTGEAARARRHCTGGYTFRMKIAALGTAVALVAVPLLAREQSLAELAERQKKARKASGQTKVITEDDLKRVGTPYVPASTSGEAVKPEASAGASGATADKPAEKSPEEQRAEKRAEIDKKLKQWTDFIAETKAQMDQAQLELNDISSLTWGNRRAGLQKILDEGAQHIAEAQQAIADLQEEARRAGIPVSR